MKTITRCLIPILGLISIVHFGCRTLSTSKNNLPSESAINGMLYYLPIGKITIKGEFKSEASQTGRLRLSSSGTSSPRGKPGSGDGSSEGGTAISAGALTITLTSEVEPDESAEYYVIPHANYIYEDETRVTVNAKHLLSTGNVTSEDKTAEIVGVVASLAREVTALTEVNPSPTPTPTPSPFYFSFHPSNSKEYGDVKSALETRGIRLEVTYPQQQPQTGGKEISLSHSMAQQIGEEGLIFRPGIPYKVTLRYPDTNFDKSQTLIDTTHQFILPDTNRLYEIKYNRMAFVKKVKEIGFTDGMLTEFHQKVPSPILGFLGIPKAVVQAIVPIPAAPPSGSGSASGTTASQQPQ